MKRFSMGALTDWAQVGAGQSVRFELPASGVRRVAFDVMSDALVSVMTTDLEGRQMLVAHAEGLFQVEFGMARENMVTFFAPPDASIYIKTRVKTQVLKETGEPAFTNIEPRRLSASERVTRIQQIAAENAQRRVEALMRSLTAKSDEIDRKLADQKRAEAEAAKAKADAEKVVDDEV